MTDTKKKAGRKPIDTTIPEKPEVNQELVEEDSEATAVLGQQLKQVDDQFGDNLPYDRSRVESECKFYLVQSTQAMLELGKRLIQLKEHEVHGDFTESLERIGLEPRTAQNMMKATVKFQGKNETVSLLGKGKLYALMTEEDEDLQELEQGGTVAGLALDDVDRMSVSELKKALRDSKTKVEEITSVKDKQIASKDQKINKLDEELTRLEEKKKNFTPTSEWEAEDLNTRILIASSHAQKSITEMGYLIDEVMMNETLAKDPGSRDLVAGVMYASSNQVASKLAEHMQMVTGSFDHIRTRATPILDAWLETHEEK